MLCFLVGISACQRDKATGVMQTITTSSKEKEKDDPFIQGNKKIVQLEDEEIDLFLKRYGWQVVKSGSGLRMEVLSRGAGAAIQTGDSVTLQYRTLLLTGEALYDSETDGAMRFVVGKTEAMTGLHEAVQQLCRGGEARLILPSHLAHGMAGDGNKIVGRRALAMHIKIDN